MGESSSEDDREVKAKATRRSSSSDDRRRRRRSETPPRRRRKSATPKKRRRSSSSEPRRRRRRRSSSGDDRRKGRDRCGRYRTRRARSRSSSPDDRERSEKSRRDEGKVEETSRKEELKSEGGGAAGGFKAGEFHLSLSVDATNELRRQLGLRDLRTGGKEKKQDKETGSAARPSPRKDAPRSDDSEEEEEKGESKGDAAAEAGAGVPHKDDDKEFKKGAFNEAISIAATNKLRSELGLRPLHGTGGVVGEERTDRNEIVVRDKVKAEVCYATQDLRLDKRIGVGKVRTSSTWDEAYLAKGQSGEYSEFKNMGDPRDRGGTDFKEPNFDKGIWNTNLNAEATNKLRKSLGLKPLGRAVPK